MSSARPRGGGGDGSRTAATHRLLHVAERDKALRQLDVRLRSGGERKRCVPRGAREARRRAHLNARRRGEPRLLQQRKAFLGTAVEHLDLSQPPQRERHLRVRGGRDE